MNLYHLALDTPIGTLRLSATADALVAAHLPGLAGPPPTPSVGPLPPVLTQAGDQLVEYLAGKRRTFDLPLDPPGTEFQRAVWRALETIPFGETRSYGEIAAAVGRPSASRAVGAANGQNPIAIIVPCHRVIGADGSLTGYGGGLPLKEWLLQHERRAMQGEGRASSAVPVQRELCFR